MPDPRKIVAKRESNIVLNGKSRLCLMIHFLKGCFAYLDLIWLINKADLFEPNCDEFTPYYEWINEYPENINDFCMFGLDFNVLDLEYETLALNVIGVIKKAVGKPSDNYSFSSNGWSCEFFTKYQGGINILNELSPKIDNEIIKFCRS